MNLAVEYKIRYSDGGIDHAGDLEEAHQILIERYGKEVVYCDNSEAVPYPYEREIDNAGRILVWANNWIPKTIAVKWQLPKLLRTEISTHPQEANEASPAMAGLLFPDGHRTPGSNEWKKLWPIMTSSDKTRAS
jgi:hypothetical protein